MTDNLFVSFWAGGCGNAALLSFSGTKYANGSRQKQLLDLGHTWRILVML